MSLTVEEPTSGDTSPLLRWCEAPEIRPCLDDLEQPLRRLGQGHVIRRLLLHPLIGPATGVLAQHADDVAGAAGLDLDALVELAGTDIGGVGEDDV